MKIICLAACAFLSFFTQGFSQAKYFVSPQDYATKEAPGSNGVFVYSKPYSYMQINGDLRGTPKKITKISFRQEGRLTIKNFILRLSLRMSSSVKTYNAPSPVFAENHGKDVTEVISSRIIHFPGSVAPKTPPAAFKYHLSFVNKPFLYTGKSDLCSEIRIHYTINSYNTIMDGLSIRGVYYWDFGKACGNFSKFSTKLSVNTSTPTAWLINAHAQPAPWKQPYFWLVGMNNKSWGSIKLPLDLTPWGGRGCSLYVNPIMIVSGIVSSRLYYNHHWISCIDTKTIIFPHDPHFTNLSLFSQIYCFSPGTPGLPLEFTQGNELRVPSMPVACTITASSDRATKGNITNLECAVTRFTYY